MKTSGTASVNEAYLAEKYNPFRDFLPAAASGCFFVQRYIRKGEKNMNKNILKKYYEMQGKVILPEQKDNDNVALAASVAANFASIGFPMTTEQTKALAKAYKEDII